ncbi:hypothetical protein [Cecembia rubra]|uniref:Lipocalin-like protein n=1 Tax=Cecembia rubra TaxID=1485585 RepID=A0A2P8EE10_9BACT|nr:hypothetical protein [Cecembia rubra]PSL07712.1 hypothetical protein CLV48_101650 [Cecembia rubra]
MKNLIVKPLGFLLLCVSFGACNLEDNFPEVNPIIGEWKADGENFLSLKVNGEEKSLEEFGVEVLRSNSSSAVSTAEDYLSFNFLGPIDLYDPQIQIAGQEMFTALVKGESVSGIWKLQNAGTVLHLNSLDLRENGYFYNIQNITPEVLELGWSWDMSYIGETSGVYRVQLKIKLAK